MTEMEKILNKRPGKAVFELPMVANSTTEVWVDVATKLKRKQAWHIVGLAWHIERTDATTPLNTMPSASLTRCLQLQRNQEHETLLPYNDNDLIAAEYSEYKVATAAGFEERLTRRKALEINDVTVSPFLRVLFQTGVDDVIISDPLWLIRGWIEYHVVSAPDDGRTKIEIPIDEI